MVNSKLSHSLADSGLNASQVKLAHGGSADSMNTFKIHRGVPWLCQLELPCLTTLQVQLTEASESELSRRKPPPSLYWALCLTNAIWLQSFVC